MNLTRTIVLFLIPLLLISCSSNKSFFKEYGNIIPERTEPNSIFNEWQNHYFSTEDCKCVYGSEYFIATKEAPSYTSNLMISLQGGGACWPGLEQCKPVVTEEDVRAGAFAIDLSERLAQEWNQVVIPYCDGSTYLGDTERDYDSDGTVDHWHYGLKNSVAALDFIHDKFPGVTKIFLTGCSAGGYGTIIQSRLLKELYPDASIYVLNESGPGIVRPETEFLNMLDRSWNLKQLIPNDCDACSDQLLYWYEDILKDPKIKVGLYSAYEDNVIGHSFLNLTPVEYKSLLLKTSGDVNSRYPTRFKRFFIKGDSHCVQDRDYEVNGTTYWDWVMAFIHDEEYWVDILE